MFDDCRYLSIYSKTPEKPKDWHYFWNPDALPVYFGFGGFMEANDFEYILVDGNALITQYLGSETTIEAPSIIEGYHVTEIGKTAFAYCDNITSVILPEGLEVIGNYAFSYCTNLKKHQTSGNSEKYRSLRFPILQEFRNDYSSGKYRKSRFKYLLELQQFNNLCQGS